MGGADFRLKSNRGVIAVSLDHICAERVQPNLLQIAQHLAQPKKLILCPTVLVQLGQISVLDHPAPPTASGTSSTPLAPAWPRVSPPADARDSHEALAWNEAQPGPWWPVGLQTCGNGVSWDILRPPTNRVGTSLGMCGVRSARCPICTRLPLRSRTVISAR
jgi:hypothetical protein